LQDRDEDLIRMLKLSIKLSVSFGRQTFATTSSD